MSVLQRVLAAPDPSVGVLYAEGPGEAHTVPAGQTVSYGTYFNAFPASYWAHWTPLRQVGLEVDLSGPATLAVMRSTPEGAAQVVSTRTGQGPAQHRIDLPLEGMSAGGWYWFEVTAGPQGPVGVDAAWTGPPAPAGPGRVSVVITTCNRADYCVRTLLTIASAPRLRAILDEVLVIDNGTRRVRDEPGLEPLAAELGTQLRIIEQQNIGGSGGFARGMEEALSAGRSDYVVLLDDDVMLEPESIVRLAAFADHTGGEIIVGGHMFDLNRRTVMHAYAETIDPWRFHSALPGPQDELRHDFARSSLPQTPWLHRRGEADYTGWWMCLIPAAVIRKVGLPMPFFLKWDDTEHALRAGRAGIPTLTLPGAALWHMTWADKDDLVSWQAYYQVRNRLITAMLFSRFPRGGGVLAGITAVTFKHIISMQHYPATLRIQAMRDLRRDPQLLASELATRAQQVMGEASGFSDSRLIPAPATSLAAAQEEPRPAPAGAGLLAWAARALLRQLRPAADGEGPLLTHRAARWWELGSLDAARVVNADGTGYSQHRRDPRAARQLAAAAITEHLRLMRQWQRLRGRYLRTHRGLRSRQGWRAVFDAATPPPAGTDTSTG